MRKKRLAQVITGVVTAVMLFQATPGGMLTAYAATNGITVTPKTDALQAELAAKADDYPAGAFAFYTAATDMKEGDGDREIQVVRWGDTSAEATLDVKVLALTATYGEDFEVYTKRGLLKDVLTEQAPEQKTEEPAGEPAKDDATDAKADDAKAGGAEDEAASEPVAEEAAGDTKADDPADPAENATPAEQNEEKVPFTAATPEPEAEPAESEADAAPKAEGDGISSMRESYAIQTGKDTKRTDWRGEYEESLAPVATVEAANNIVNAIPGATGTLTFAPGEYVKSVFINVKDDALAESKEAFKLVLGNASAGILGEQMQHTVSIEDNEESERIAFAMKDAEVTVAADAEYAEVGIVRTSGKDYYAGAVVGTVADSATPEASYEAMDNAAVSFASGTAEQTVRIPLKDGAQPGTQFKVRLDQDATNVDGTAETVVKIEEAAEPNDPDASIAAAANSDSQPAAAPAAANDVSDQGVASAAYEHDGITYDSVTVKPDKRADADGVNASASFTYTNTLSTAAARIAAKISVWGSTDHWIFGEPAYKNWSMSFGGRNLINKRDCDVKSRDYTEQFDISYNEGTSGGLWLEVDTDGTNYNGRIRLNEITYYYPRYTVTMDDADYEQTLKGRNYTSTKDYTEFDVPALSEDFKDKTETVRRDGSVSVFPSNMTSGVHFDAYEIYSGDTKVGERSDSVLTYSELNELRKDHEDTLRRNKYQIRIKPVYKADSATVSFEAQDASAVSFSGDKKGGKGFKAGDTLKATCIDTVTMTAECPNDQRVKPLAISQYYSKFSFWKWKTIRVRDRYFKGDGGLTLTVKDVPIERSSQIFEAMHQDVTLTYEYTPSEASAANAGAGAIAVYDAGNLAEPLGVSNYKEPLTLRDTLDMIAGNKYVTRVIKSELPDGVEDKDKINYFLESEPIGGIPFSTRTIWTYTDPKTGQKKSVKGQSLMFDPYYADEVVNYHFKNEQDDQQKVGVKGTVYIEEAPLFQGAGNESGADATRKTRRAAVGVQLDVGGVTTTSDQSGQYTIDPKFNKGDYVSAFLTYDSLNMMDNVALSENSVKDFSILVDETDALKVTDSTITKPKGTGVWGMDNKDITADEEVSSVLLEDAEYTFTVAASGSAGITPGKAEFRFYDKIGHVRADKTITVDFADGKAVLKLNPKSHGLDVGDSMTVKLFDTKGKGYFEHQTVVVIGRKATGTYMFNYEGIKSDDDNLFLKALGKVSMGYDFVLDAMSSDAGTYTDSTGAQHQLKYVGFGDGFKSEEVYNTLQQTIAEIDDARTGTNKISSYDSIAFFGDGSWSFDISLGIIYDMVMEESGEKKGDYKFSDYVILAEANAGYNKEWGVPAGPANLTFGLGFTFGDESRGKDGVSVKWHFYDPDDQGFFVKENSAINLMDSDEIENKGFFALNANVTGSLRAEFLGSLIGGEGSLLVTVDNNLSSASDGKIRDYGDVILTPKVKLVVLGIGIPIWSRSWAQPWDTMKDKSKEQASAAMMSAINEGMSANNILFTSTDKGERQDYSYAENRSGWNSGSADAGLFSFFSAPAADDEGEQVVQDKFLADSDVAMYNLGGGTYLAAFLDVVPGRDDANKMGAYYSVYADGKWSKPVLLKDDGTEDQVPVISDAGEKGVLIAWSSANKKLDANADLSARLNTFDIQGAFYKNGKLGEVMQITQTNDEDTYADTNPQAVCYTKDGSTRLKLYYTKSEFKVSDTKEGEVVGDLLNPDQLNLTREYDFATNKWADSYDDKTAEGIKEYLRGQLIKQGTKDPTPEQVEEAYKKYVKDWYGQVFLDLAPAVDVSETLDENGRWTAEPTITELKDNVASARMVKDSAAIAYNGLGLLAYSLDKGGMAQTTGDQNLYLQIFNAEQNEYHHPIMISGTNAEISDIQFSRSTYKGQDGKDANITWLYWKEQTSEGTTIKRIDISTLVGKEENLIKREVGGQIIYLVNKAADNGSYAPEQVLVNSTPKADAGEDFTTIGNFQVKSSADGRYNFIAWTQPVTVGEGDNVHQEFQLFAAREDTYNGEVSSPVQLTDKTDQYLTEFDFAVTDKGDIDVLTGRQTLEAKKDEETGATHYEPNPETSQLVSMHITPSDAVTVDDAVEGELRKDDGKVAIDLSTVIRNESFDAIKDVNIEAVDSNGKVVYSSKDEELVRYEGMNEVKGEDGGITFEGGSQITEKRGLITLGGGADYELSFRVPVDKSGAYDVTLKVTADGKEISTKQLKGQVPVRLTSTELVTSIPERNKVKLSATISNETVLASEERTVAYGYFDAEGKQVELGTKKLKKLKPGAATEFSVTLDQDFAEFDSKILDDGSQRDSRKYYLGLEPAGKAAKADAETDEGVVDEGNNTATVVYGEVALVGTAGQVSLMKKANNLGAVLVTDDGEGGVKRADNVKAGEYAELGLTVDGKLTQESEELINGFKVAWDEVDNSVAKVDADGTFLAKKEGTVKLTGKVMPANTESVVAAQGGSAEVDNYSTLPASLIKPIEVSLTVGKGGGTGDTGTGDTGGSGTDGTDTGTGDSNKGGKLPQLGDMFNPVYVIVITAAGVALIATGAHLRRRNKQKGR